MSARIHTSKLSGESTTPKVVSQKTGGEGTFAQALERQMAPKIRGTPIQTSGPTSGSTAGVARPAYGPQTEGPEAEPLRVLMDNMKRELIQMSGKAPMAKKSSEASDAEGEGICENPGSDGF